MSQREQAGRSVPAEASGGSGGRPDAGRLSPDPALHQPLADSLHAPNPASAAAAVPTEQPPPPVTEPVDAVPPPSPPWYGGITTFGIFFMAAILLSYTLLDIPWQQRLGGWNYVVVIALIPLLSAWMLKWHADPARNG